jgi:hypothetical protein
MLHWVAPLGAETAMLAEPNRNGHRAYTGRNRAASGLMPRPFTSRRLA